MGRSTCPETGTSRTRPGPNTARTARLPPPTTIGHNNRWHYSAGVTPATYERWLADVLVAALLADS